LDRHDVAATALTTDGSAISAWEAPCWIEQRHGPERNRTNRQSGQAIRCVRRCDICRSPRRTHLASRLNLRSRPQTKR